ncbi:MAG: cupin domain-containing protein [Cellvibrionaceae bacterium]
MPESILSHLGDLPIDQFLKDYWQKKPLLIRNTFPNFVSPISADELAGLSLEDAVESRIIVEGGGSDTEGKGPWDLQCGPFSEESFQNLPSSHWTLLVQAVDQWVPEIAALLRRFYFLPSWRLDDVMISYAPNGGSVGPHYDQYDVFLVQAQGQREWQVGGIEDEHSPRLHNTDLHILSDFSPSDTWVLNPGDMLYLPPQFSHWGVAKNDCMTYSVGFRAPSHSELLARFADDLISRLPESVRYTDASITAAAHIGGIPREAITHIHSALMTYLENDDAIASWFGALVTERKYADQDVVLDEPVSDEDWLNELRSGCRLIRNEGSRFAFFVDEHGSEIDICSDADIQAKLFIDGETYQCAKALAELLCKEHEIVFEQLEALMNEASQQLITGLINTGAFYMAE